MTVTFHALWMLCALGTAVIGTAVGTSVRDRAAVAAGFGLAALLTSGSNLPDPVWTGGLVMAAVAALLFRPRLRLPSLAIGGALPGFWASLLEVQGLPAWTAVLLPGALLIGTMRLSQMRPSFAPEELREEALLAIGVLGLGVAVVPGVLDGWHAARNLSGAADATAEAGRHVRASIPMWTLAVLIMASSLGAVYSLWSRR